MSSYLRETELRHLHQKDSYELSFILDDNEGWLDLIQVIPKKIDNESFNLDESIDSEEFLPIKFYSSKNSILFTVDVRLIYICIGIRKPTRKKVITQGMDSQAPVDGYLLEIVDNKWLEEELPFEQILVPSHKLPDPEADGADSHLTLSEQEQKWIDLALGSLAPESSLSDQLTLTTS
uniref:Anaphase-promoting complex subunit 13 n=1 Tax=Glossina pallidipes TaxID=7398 RepID=A0A1B0AA14_GLOPL